MPKNKKKFIDKKTAVTFHLVHRSQRDPLVTDDKAPQHVLKEVVSKKAKNETEEEHEKFGIYFDDDYNYMQHLRPIEGKGEMIWTETKPTNRKTGTKPLELPSSVFESHVEEKIGVLNKAAPKSGLQLDLDPDIVAAMDEDFDFSDPENKLEDNFIELANGGPEGFSEELESDPGSDFMESDEEYDEVGSIDMIETKSRFTDYSMTSSVIKRNEQLTILDDRFEEMFADYDDNEIGALEGEEIEGVIDPKSGLLVQYADEFEKDKTAIPLIPEHTEIYSDSESTNSEDSMIEVVEKPQWDCESILSTNSTLYNHPKVLDAPKPKIRVNPKTGIPETGSKLTAKALASLNDEYGHKATGPGSLVSIVSTLSIRPKDEKPEERKDRKKAFREYKKERRVERKLNTEAFKEEKRRMEKMMAHNKSKFIVHL